MDKVIKKSGAEINSEYSIIRSGYITYYFEPLNKTVPTDNMVNETIRIFGDNGIGPTFYWLNKEWYKKNWTGRPSIVSIIAEPYGPYIRIRFETLFPLLEDFRQNDVLQSPPQHILDIAKKANLKFIKSERRDSLGYSYSIDMRRWFERIFGINRYFTIGLNLLGKREADNSISTIDINKINCVYPYPYSYDSRGGIPPARDKNSPDLPVVIPSCFEYLKWYQCKVRSRFSKCKAVSLDPPICKNNDVHFSTDDY